MREIKFRAWDKKQKKMIPVTGIDFEFPQVDEYGVLHPMVDVILIQFTGLHDKNGKEIYEGDIANITLGLIAKGGYTERGVMEFNKESAQFSFLCKDSLFEEPQERPDAFTIEVIGNIYENPDLLKGVQE